MRCCKFGLEVGLIVDSATAHTTTTLTQEIRQSSIPFALPPDALPIMVTESPLSQALQKAKDDIVAHSGSIVLPTGSGATKAIQSMMDEYAIKHAASKSAVTPTSAPTPAPVLAPTPMATVSMLTLPDQIKSSHEKIVRCEEDLQKEKDLLAGLKRKLDLVTNPSTPWGTLVLNLTFAELAANI